MAMWSAIARATVRAVSRLDAEYFRPDYLQLSKTLDSRNPNYIGDFAFVTDGIHASPDAVEEGGIRYLSAKCVKNNDFAIGDTLFISAAQHNSNKRTQMIEGDVLVTTVGTIGNAAVVTNDLLPANADRHLGIIRIRTNTELDPYYVATFLNTRFGRFQTLREATGNVQLNLFIEKIKTLRVVRIAEHDRVAELTRQGYATRANAELHYMEAERLLESALRLDKIPLARPLFYERRLADVQDAARLDAEYACVPDLVTVWKPPFSIRPLGDPTVSRRVSNGLTPAASDYGSTGVPIIKVADITTHGSADFGGEFVAPGTKTLNSSKGRIQPGDVLMIAAAHHIRYIGKAGILETWPDERKQCQCVGELIAIRPSRGIHGEVLMCYLNTPAVRAQVQRLVRGMSAHLYPNDLRALPVPLVDIELQNKIVRKVRDSFDARQQAQRCLDKAKAMIEEAIIGGR